MNTQVKVVVYALLVLLASISGVFALRGFGELMAKGSERGAGVDQIEPERKPPVETNAPPEQTNTVPVTNAPAGTNNALSTNAEAAAVITSNTPPQATAEVPAAAVTRPAAARPKKSGSHLGLWSVFFVLSLVGLGILAANDVSQFLAARALKAVYNEEGEGVKDPDYEEAEKVWANGQHLEAINLMREYLKKNPREQHAAIRIAEIYEKDLRNPLAAALEYEEVLKHKLPEERWGWAAIHLCNLYFKLNQEQKAFELLRRVVADYPTTAAAEKARKRLEQVDGVAPVEQIATEPKVSGTTPARPIAGPPPPANAAPASNLPPGFRPKKG